MPSRLFRSTCGHQSAGVLMGRDQCATCGEPFFGPVVHDLRTGEMLGVEGLEEGEA